MAGLIVGTDARVSTKTKIARGSTGIGLTIASLVSSCHADPQSGLFDLISTLCY